jgi:hypothetical protein
LVIFLVLGKRLTPVGQLPWEFVEQVDKGVHLVATITDSVLVISGGVTRAGFASEAEAAKQFVPVGLLSRTLLETRAMSTRQNITNVRMLLWQGKINVDQMVVISSKGHEERVRYLFGEIWPEMLPYLSFQSVGECTSRDRVVHKILYWLTRLDRHERIFLPLKQLLF